MLLVDPILYVLNLRILHQAILVIRVYCTYVPNTAMYTVQSGRSRPILRLGTTNILETKIFKYEIFSLKTHSFVRLALKEVKDFLSTWWSKSTGLTGSRNTGILSPAEKKGMMHYLIKMPSKHQGNHFNAEVKVP